MAARTTSWTCDACRQQITGAANGLVEWTPVDKGIDFPLGYKDLRIVHRIDNSDPAVTPHNCCDPHNKSYLPLDHYLGGDGLMYLMGKVSDGSMELADFFELVKRIHVPGYERIRLIVDDIVAEHDLEFTGVDNLPGFWSQAEIDSVLKHARAGKHPRRRTPPPSEIGERGNR